MMTKAWLSVLVLFITVAVLQWSSVLGRSLSKRQEVWTIGSIASDLPECIPYTHPVCNQFSTYTLSFNPSRENTEEFGIDKLLEEFRGFEHYGAGLSDCHPNIILFLCFAYFPVCDPSSYQPSSVSQVFDYAVYPCRETCEEIHDSVCTDRVKESLAGGWAPHLQCNHSVDISKYQKPVEVYPAGGSRVRFCANGGGGDINKNMSSGDEEEITEAPTPTPKADCPHKGNYRKNCNANTFKNNCYEFAAHVNVTSTSEDEDGNVKFTVDVVEEADYDLVSDQNGECRRAPRLQARSACIQTDWHECCTDCPNIKVGTQYLLGGYYSEDSHGNTIFRLECDDSLVSEWRSKYQKKLPKWLVETDRYRRRARSDSKCTNFC